MLSQFYNRRNSLEAPRREPASQQQQQIINSFYEQRKSRSSANVKQHNLLRKNISYFNREQQESPPKVTTATTLNSSLPQKKNQSFIQPNVNIAQLSKPPIPRASNEIEKSSKQVVQGVPVLPLRELSHNASQVSSCFSSVHLSKVGSQQQQFKANLKKQLSKRINIQHYLSEISEDKENPSPLASSSQFKLKYNYDYSVPQRIPSQNISEEFSRISFQNSGEERAVHESRQSISSLLHQQPQNNFEFSRNSLTDRIAQNSREKSIHYRNSVPTLGDSARRSQSGSKKTEKQFVGKKGESVARNVLSGEQLSDLQQNSHPIREEGAESAPTTHKHQTKYFEPEVHAEYRRKIGDLQREIQCLKNQRKREDKFISSIQKMRMLMQGSDEECSLKELWRWIKGLPLKK